MPLAQALRSGYEIGRSTGGSGIGLALKKIADRLRGRRETGEELAGKKELLREEARLREPKERDTKKDILGLISGIRPPEDVLTPEQITAVAPRTLGRAMGGEVLAPAGARFEGGQIVSPTGEMIGEYTPGLEPKPFTPAIGAGIGQRLGVTREEATREYLGLPKAEKLTGRITASVAINILSDPIKARQFKQEFGEEAFEELKSIATGGFGKVSLMKGRGEPAVDIMDTNF